MEPHRDAAEPKAARINVRSGSRVAIAASRYTEFGHEFDTIKQSALSHCAGQTRRSEHPGRSLPGDGTPSSRGTRRWQSPSSDTQQCSPNRRRSQSLEMSRPCTTGRRLCTRSRLPPRQPWVSGPKNRDRITENRTALRCLHRAFPVRPARRQVRPPRPLGAAADVYAPFVQRRQHRCTA